MRPSRISRMVPGKSAVKAEAKKQRAARSHVELVKMLPCCATMSTAPSDPHHLMRGVERGIAMTAAGRYVVPLSRSVHTEITPHGDPEAVLMERYGVPARELADALWSVSPDVEAMLRIVHRTYWEAQQRLVRARE